jgi:hemin uptake protein HemP
MNAITRIDTPRYSGASDPIHDAYALTKGGQTAQILLDGKVYQLRITRAGKLILTK